jgi:hypothetical protein
MVEMLKWGAAATLFATAQASADGDAGRGKTLFHPLQLMPRSDRTEHRDGLK